jgi:hypothetical protein
LKGAPNQGHPCYPNLIFQKLHQGPELPSLIDKVVLLYWERIVKDDLACDFIAIIVRKPTKIHKILFLTGLLIAYTFYTYT